MSKKIQLLIPEDLLDEVKVVAKEKEVHINDVVCHALDVYVKNEINKIRKNKLKKGYLEMAQINCAYAEMCLNADNQALSVCEEKLSECE
jgi:CopG family transcriptional regulator/antitoxin EndoAI